MGDVLVSAVLGPILQSLKSLVLREFAIAWGLKTDLDNLEKTSSTIQAVLQDAEELQWKSRAVKNWLKRLKDVANEIEDVIDEFYARAAILKVKSERKRGLLHKGGAFFSLPNRLVFRLKIGEKIRNVNRKLDAVGKDRQFHLISNSETGRSALPETTSLVIQSHIFGRDNEREKIIDLFLHRSNDDGLFVYAICGMGGLGKTTLANLIYNDPRMDTFNLKIWICVSEDFNIRRLARAVLESIEGRGPDLHELESLQRRIQDKMRGNRYLLVLDDVWNEDIEKWNTLKNILGCGLGGSIIIVTTRIEKIARMMASTHIHYLSSLSEDDSWSLFKERAIGVGKMEEYMETIGRNILMKCCGVPLAINALGGLTCMKNGEDEWRSIMESEIWDLQDDESSVFSALRLSYCHLPSYLRQCFTYCCIFAKDFDMVKDDLIHLWMANGFIPSREGLHWYDIGQEIFRDLVSRSFIQEVTEHIEKGTRCKIHDLMHDLASSIMRDECFNTKSERKLVSGQVRHLYWDMESTSGHLILPTKFQSLRSLFLAGHGHAGVADLPIVLSKQEHLRVLTQRLRGRMLPSIDYSKLLHLRYLNLAYSNIEFLPKSVIYLQNLLVLNLKSCKYLRELPKDMKYLKRLGYLNIRKCLSLKDMPEMRQLKNQQFFVNGLWLKMGNSHQIGDLGEFNPCGYLWLDELQNIGNSKEAESADLKSKRNLQYLKLSWQISTRGRISPDVDGIMDALQPYSNLKELAILSYPGLRLPIWLSNFHLHNLTTIKLSNCSRCEFLPPLEKFPFLKNLYVGMMHSVQYIVTEHYDDSIKLFPSLRFLYLRDVPSLVAWSAMNRRDIFPQLQNAIFREWRSNCLRLNDLSSLTELGLISCHFGSLPDGLENLKLLKELRIEACDNLDSLSVNALQGLSSLRTLIIIDCKKFVSLSEGMKHLTALQELTIENCPEIRTLSKWLHHLKGLTMLYIKYCVKFSSLPSCIGSLESLSTLVILSCWSLTSLPDGLRNSTSLKVLEIRGCPDLAKRCQKQIGEDWPRINHIPNIWIDTQPIQTTEPSEIWKRMYTEDTLRINWSR